MSILRMPKLTKTSGWSGGRPRQPLALYTPLRTIQQAGAEGITSPRLATFNGSFRKLTLQQRRECLLDLAQRGLVEVVKGSRGSEWFVSAGDPETEPGDRVTDRSPAAS